jgi:hypothetical protein
MVVAVSVLYFCLWTITAVHEAGHWLAASLCQFRVQEVRVGTFRWYPASGWKPVLERKYLLGGLVKAQLTDYKRAFRGRYLVFILAGPVASFLAGVCGWSLAQTVKSESLAGCMSFWSAGSIFVGLVNCFPIKKGRSRTDGRKMFDVLFRDDLQRLRFAVCCMDSKDELLDAIRTNDNARAKAISRVAVSLGEGLPTGDELSHALEVLKRIIAAPDVDTLAAELGAGPIVAATES